MERALRGYEDGTPWEFGESLGLHGAMVMGLAASAAEDGDGGGGKSKKGRGEEEGGRREAKGGEGGEKENRGINLVNVQPPHLAGFHEAVREAMQKSR